jgi:hypothetical protein
MLCSVSVGTFKHDGSSDCIKGPRNVVVEWITLMLRIREVPGSNLGPETGYLHRLFVVFLSPSRQIPG